MRCRFKHSRISQLAIAATFLINASVDAQDGLWFNAPNRVEQPRRQNSESAKVWFPQVEQQRPMESTQGTDNILKPLWLTPASNKERVKIPSALWDLQPSAEIEKSTPIATGGKRAAGRSLSRKKAELNHRAANGLPADLWRQQQAAQENAEATHEAGPAEHKPLPPSEDIRAGVLPAYGERHTLEDAYIRAASLHGRQTFDQSPAVAVRFGIANELRGEEPEVEDKSQRVLESPELEVSHSSLHPAAYAAEPVHFDDASWITQAQSQSAYDAEVVGSANDSEDSTLLDADRMIAPLGNAQALLGRLEVDEDLIDQAVVIESDVRLDPESLQWPAVSKTWISPVFHHKPLFFEQPNLERYGQGRRCFAQPVVSSAHFFGSIFIVPYKVLTHHPRERYYTLGSGRPGNRVSVQRRAFLGQSIPGEILLFWKKNSGYR